MTGGFLCQQFPLVASLDDINQHENNQHEVERAFLHRFDLVAEQVNVREMPAFGNEQDADNEQDEQSEYFVHPVLLQEFGNGICHKDHHQAAQHNGRRHDDDAVHGIFPGVRIFVHDRHCAQDRIE